MSVTTPPSAPICRPTPGPLHEPTQVHPRLSGRPAPSQLLLQRTGTPRDRPLHSRPHVGPPARRPSATTPTDNPHPRLPPGAAPAGPPSSSAACSSKMATDSGTTSVGRSPPERPLRLGLRGPHPHCLSCWSHPARLRRRRNPSAACPPSTCRNHCTGAGCAANASRCGRSNSAAQPCAASCASWMLGVELGDLLQQAPLGLAASKRQLASATKPCLLLPDNFWPLHARPSPMPIRARTPPSNSTPAPALAPPRLGPALRYRRTARRRQPAF